jgi:hypothetical protein
MAIAIIARKDGEQVRSGRATSDYSKAFTRMRDAIAALPVKNAVIDGEAVLIGTDTSSDFEGLRSRPEAILVASGMTCALLWKSAGNAWRNSYRAGTRRSVKAFSSGRRSPETGPPSFVTPAGCA